MAGHTIGETVGLPNGAWFGEHIVGSIIAVAIHTPTHGEWCPLFYTAHLFDGAVTCLAFDVSVYVWTVIEVDVIGNPMHTYPFDGRARFESSRHLLDFRIILNDVLVAVHANGGRRYTGIPSPVSTNVTILTWDLHLPRMQCVRVLNRLLGLIPLVIGLTRNQEWCAN